MKKTAVNLLFVQVGKYGSLTPIKDKAGFYQLTLREVGDYVHYFSDRPNRTTGLYSTTKFINQWDNDTNSNGFNKTPPNAAMSAVQVHLFKNKQVNIILQLSAPSYNAEKHTITYTAQILPGEQGIMPMKHLDQVALFIDSYCASCVGKGF